MAKIWNRLLVLAILILILSFMFGVFIRPAFTDRAIADQVEVTATEMPTPTPTPDSVVTIEFIPSPTPVDNFTMTPAPTQDAVFVVEDFDMPRDVEVWWLKVLWYCPIRTVKGNNPNPEKVNLLWVLINEFQSSKVIDSTGKVIEYWELSDADKTNHNFTYLYPRDWEKLLMRPGDHDWFRNAVETNQPWHESEANSRIVNIVYDVWQSELKGLNSGRNVPREYIYYAFVKDSSGANRKLEIYRTKEDLQNGENAYIGFLKGTLDR